MGSLSCHGGEASHAATDATGGRTGPLSSVSTRMELFLLLAILLLLIVMADLAVHAVVRPFPADRKSSTAADYQDYRSVAACNPASGEAKAHRIDAQTGTFGGDDVIRVRT